MYDPPVPTTLPPAAPVTIPAPVLLDAGPSRRGWHYREGILRCPQRAAWRAELQAAGTRLAEDRTALTKGSLLHIGLAHFWARVQAHQQGWDVARYYTPHDAVAELATRQDGASGLLGEGSWAQYVEGVQQMLQLYIQWIGASVPTVIAVEHEVDLAPPAIWGEAAAQGVVYVDTRRLDLLVMRSDGRFTVVDHKTAGRIDGKKRAGFVLSGQLVGIEWWGRRTYGDRWGGVEVTLCQWPGAGPAGTDAKFEQYKPPIAPWAVSKYPGTVQWSEELEALGEKLYGGSADEAPLALSEQGPCVDRYGICEFAEQCRLGWARR